MGNTADDFSWSATYIAPSSNMKGSLQLRNSLISTGLISECPMSLTYFYFQSMSFGRTNIPFIGLHHLKSL